jgi:hypothetical protein
MDGQANAQNAKAGATQRWRYRAPRVLLVDDQRRWQTHCKSSSGTSVRSSVAS